MNRQFLFIKSATESIALPVDSFSHAEYTSDASVALYFNATRSGKGASIKVILTVSSGKANDVVSSVTSQVASGNAPVMKFDAVADAFYVKNVTGITSISTTEDPVSALTGQGVEPGGSTGQVLAKASSDDYDTEWADYNTLYVTVKNTSGGTLLKGTPVHATGATAGVANVIAADASIPSAMPATYVLNEDIANNNSGQAIIVGVISDIDTSSFSAGDVVYVASGGGFTNVKPTGTNAIQNLGVVTKSSASGGSGIVYGSGRSNDVPNIPDGQTWIGNASGVATPTTLSDVATSGAYSDLSGTPSIPVSGVDFDPVGTDNSTDITLAGTYDYITIAGQTITRNQVDYNTDIANTPSIPTSGVDFDPVGTDNSTDVTLAGAYNYLTLAGQQITLGQVDYTTDISNTPAIPVSGVDFDPAGTDNSTDVTLAGAYNYLTLAGQEITLGQVDYTTDVSNTPTIPTSGVDFDPVGTDNSTDVTLSGTYDYITIAGQTLLLNQVDYNTDIANTPSIPTSGVDFDPVGTDNSTDVTLAGAYNYLTLAGQQITLGQVDYTTDISNTPTIPTSGVDFDPVGTDNSTDVSINANATDVLRMNPGQILGSQDAGADKLVFWDDSEGKLTYATIGTNLTMTADTLSASGGGGSANMSQSFTAPTNIGEFQDGARLITNAYGTAPAATAGTLVSFGATNVTATGAQSNAAAATGMLTVVTDAASGDELLVEGVIKLSTATTTTLLPTTAKKGSPVYMSTTDGAVTNTAPSTAGDFVRVVGHVVDATNRTIYFKPDNTWLEL